MPTYELQQEVTGVGGETCTHTSTIYSPDYLGVYHAFGANEAVWEGMRAVYGLGPEILPNWDFDTGVDGGMPTGWGSTGSNTFYRAATKNVDVAESGAAVQFYAAGNHFAAFKTYQVTYEITGYVSGSIAVRADAYGPYRSSNGVFTEETTTTFASVNRPSFYTGASGFTGTIEYITMKEIGGGDGAYYADDSAGTPLDPLPMLVYQEAGTNYAKESDGQDILSAGHTVSEQTAPSGVSMTRVMNDSYTGTDGGYKMVSTTITAFPLGNNIYASAVVEKGNKTWLGFALLYSGGADPHQGIYFNLDTGAFSDTHTRAAPEDYWAEDLGNGRWRVFLQKAADHGDAGRIYLQVTDTPSGYPATVPGDYLYFELVNYSESPNIGPIRTVGTTVSTDEIINTWSAANHSDAGDSYEMTIDYAGSDAEVLSLGGVPFLEIEGQLEAEKVINGELDTDLTSWGAKGSAATIENNRAKITVVGTIDSDINQALTLEAGKTYRLSADVEYASTNLENHYIKIWITGAVSQYFFYGGDPGEIPDVIHRLEVDFVADQEASLLRLMCGWGGGWATSGDIVYYDNVSVREINTVNKQLTLTDGTNMASVPITAGMHDIVATYNATDGMTLDVDGVTATCPYDGNLGSGDLSTKVTQRDLIRRGS